MSDFKPDNMIPDPRDRHRSTRPAGTSQEPQLNLGNLDLPLDNDAVNQRRSDDPLSNQQIKNNQLADDKLNRDHPGNFAQGGDGDGARPDSQKRRNKGSGFSRQRLVMGVAILVLLVVILLLSLTTPKPDNADHRKAPPAGEKTIDLGALSGEPQEGIAANNQYENNQQENNQQPYGLSPSSQSAATSNTSTTDASQQPTLAPPPVASTPVQDDAVDSSLPKPQQQLTVQGDLNKALVPQQPVSDASPPDNKPASHKASADKPRRQQAAKPAGDSQVNHARQPREKVAGNTRHSAAEAGKLTQGSTLTLNSLKSAPASYYTVQLSSGSSESALLQWAQKNAVKNYLVYKTSRNNQSWYVLVSGLYPSRAAAKLSLATLPGSVRAKSPWLKPVRLAQDELKNNALKK